MRVHPSAFFQPAPTESVMKPYLRGTASQSAPPEQGRTDERAWAAARSIEGLIVQAR